MGNCENCSMWRRDQGMNDREGYCAFLSENKFRSNVNGIYGLVEGCIDVHDRAVDFCFMTDEKFGCVHFIKKHGKL